MSEAVTATHHIDTSTDTVFAVLADPTTHAAIDGTGWVQQPADTSPLTATGQLFRMDMHHADHPDGDYRVVNKVVVFDESRAIGWLTGYETDTGEPEFGGWVWRYDLTSLGPSKTEVTLSYDWSAVPPRIREYLQFPPFGPDHLANSLRHLAELAA